MSRICAEYNRENTQSESFSLRQQDDCLADDRLADESSAQSFESGDMKITVALDGCIYGESFTDLAKSLEKIANGYFKKGEDFLKELNGQFAIILYDYKNEKLICARDSFAVKPMYWENGGKTVCVSSDLGMIADRPGFSKEINRDCLAGYFSRGYIMYPDTIYKNVYKLCPGEAIVFDKNGERKIKYYDLIGEYERHSANPFSSYDEAKSEVKKAIISAIDRRSSSSSSAKSFLSGGVDSSLISSILTKELGKYLDTYTLGFKESKYNEAQRAKKTASILGTNHHELILDDGELERIFDKLPDYYDEPFGDNSAIPTVAICEEAGKDPGTVIFSGDGGDEFFFGYDGYLLRRKVGRYDPLLCGVGHIVKALHLDGTVPEDPKKLLFNFDPETKTQFMNTKYGFYSRLLKDCSIDSIKYRVESSLPVRDWARRAMLIDMMTGVPGTIIKMERATEKNGLLLQLPLTNPEVAAVSFRCRDDCFFRKNSEYGKNIKKYLLKDLLLSYLPPEQVFTPKKGFSFPQNEWARKNLRDRITDYSDKAYIDKQGLFDYGVLSGDASEFLSGNKTRLSHYGFYWCWLVFQCWYEKHMK